MSKLKVRSIYADRSNTDVMRKIHVTHGPDVALMYNWLTTSCCLIHDSGVSEVSCRAIARATGFDTCQVEEILRLLENHGIHYDFDNDVILVRPLADQYIGFLSSAKNNRWINLARHTSTLPDCAGRDFLQSHQTDLKGMEGNTKLKERLTKGLMKGPAKGLAEVVK